MVDIMQAIKTAEVTVSEKAATKNVDLYCLS